MKSQFMEYGLAILEGADIAKNVFEHLADLEGILPYPGALVGVGTDGHDFSAQFLKTADVVHTG